LKEYARSTTPATKLAREKYKIVALEWHPLRLLIRYGLLLMTMT